MGTFRGRLIHLLSFVLLLSFTTSCQRASRSADSETQDAPMVVGQDSKGNKVLYGVACLRQNAADIRDRGQSAAQRCIVQGVSKTDYDRGVRGTSSLQYTYLYYPYANCWYPPYWAGNYTNPNTGYGNNLYQNFCTMIFGSQWGNSNCIANVFGWNGNYSNYGNTTTSCNQCSYSASPSSCYLRNGCWTTTSYNYYYQPYAY